MTLSREQFRERLVDYLYGELEGEDRAVFEACLAESEECRRELAAMQDTLQLARTGLTALEENPPARVKHRVLAFADQRAVAPERGARKAWWLNWWRSPGFVALAGFATIAALAVFGRHSVLEPKPVPASPDMQEREAAPPARVPIEPDGREPRTPQRATEAETEERRAPAARDQTESSAPQKREAPALRAAPEAERRYAEPPPPRASGNAQPGVSRAPAAVSGEAPARDDARGTSSSAPSPAAASGNERSRRKERSGAPRAAQKAAAESGSETPAQRERSGDVDALDGLGSSAAVPFGPALAAPVAPVAPAALAAPVAPAVGSLAALAPSAPDEAVRTAREHVDNGRLHEAARAYRELLRRYPSDPRVGAWRDQLTRVNRALAEAAPRR